MDIEKEIPAVFTKDFFSVNRLFLCDYNNNVYTTHLIWRYQNKKILSFLSVI